MPDRNQYEKIAESATHLFQPPLYTSGDGYWSPDFMETTNRCSTLTWDPAALLSYLSYGYVSCDRTLFSEVKRRPWLSEISDGGGVAQQTPPQHGFYTATPKTIASRLLSLLKVEAEQVCRGYQNIYLLTSGGLDSRIVCGVIRQLVDEKRIQADIHSVTWGMDGSRDVEIGKLVAQKLDFPWEQLRLGPEDLKKNVSIAAQHLGAMVSPVHLHRMAWLRKLPQGTLVLGGSYGDSVGRSEFSGRTVLELLPHRSVNSFGLLRKDLAKQAAITLDLDWQNYRSRFGNRPEYASCECEFQAHYMRGLIAHTMSVVNNSCRLYQMFTSPEVYGFMWSIHPSFRTNQPYAELLNLLGNDLASLPWARTNRPLASRNGIKVESTEIKYHHYPKWIKTHFLPLAKSKLFGDWLESTELFDIASFQNLIEDLSLDAYVSYERKTKLNCLVWLFSLKEMQESLEPLKPQIPVVEPISSLKETTVRRDVSWLRKRLREIPVALKIARNARKWKASREALKKYPPTKLP